MYCFLVAVTGINCHSLLCTFALTSVEIYKGSGLIDQTASYTVAITVCEEPGCKHRVTLTNPTWLREARTFF